MADSINEQGSVMLDGKLIRYKILGSGRPVLLCGDCGTLAAKLSERAKIIIADIDPAADTDDGADNLSYLLRRLGIDKTVVIGTGRYAAASLVFGLLHKNKTEKIILIDPGIKITGLKVRYGIFRALRLTGKREPEGSAGAQIDKSDISAISVHSFVITTEKADINRKQLKMILKYLPETRHEEVLSGDLEERISKLCRP